MISVGKKAPAFSLFNQDGKKVSLEDFAGKWLILYFYPKDDTPGCTTEAVDFTALLRVIEKKNAAVVGVSPDSVESHCKFKDKHKLRINLLSDEKKTVLKRYGAWGTKKNYGKEYEGVIRTTVLISPEGKISEIWAGVQVRVKKKSGEVKHAEIVASKIDELA